MNKIKQPTNLTDLSWKDYEKIANGDYSDIVLDEWNLLSLLRKRKTTIRLPNYQVAFLEQKYGEGNFSDALRSALDDLISLEAEKQKETKNKEMKKC